MQNNLIVAEEVEFELLECRHDRRDVPVLSDQHEHQNEDGIGCLEGCKAVIPAFVGEDQVLRVGTAHGSILIESWLHC